MQHTLYATFAQTPQSTVMPRPDLGTHHPKNRAPNPPARKPDHTRTPDPKTAPSSPGPDPGPHPNHRNARKPRTHCHASNNTNSQACGTI